MSSVSSTQAMATIEQEIIDYCESVGLDYEDFLTNLDNVKTADLMDIPGLEAYFQLCYVQLVAIINPDLINSLYADVGLPAGAGIDFETLKAAGIDFDEVYAAADPEFNEMILSMIEDDPELLALVAHSAGGESEANYVLDILASLYASTEEGADGDIQATSNSAAHEANDLYNLGLDWVIDQDDFYNSATQSLLQQLTEYDNAIIQLQQDVMNGMDPAEAQMQMESLKMGREALFELLQQFTERQMTFIESISDLFKEMDEANKAIIRNVV